MFGPRLVICELVCLVALALTQSEAQVPLRIGYQGRLISGTNLVNGNVSMVLRIYTNATGGSVVYEDSNTVTVIDGLYATFLGDNTTVGSLTNALATGEAFIEVVVNGTTLSPREPIGSVAYAIVADAVKPSGVDSIAIANGSVQLSDLNTNSIDPQYVNVTGDVMSGPLNLPLNGLAVGSNQFVITGGKIGIGTNNPSSQVEIIGSAIPGIFIMKLYSGADLVGWARKKD